MLNRVTFTGVDGMEDTERLWMLAGRHEIELGILVRSDFKPGKRYPTADIVREIISIFGGECSLSLHLCGRWVDDVCDGRMTFAETYPSILNGVHRIQLNFGQARRNELIHSGVSKIVSACERWEDKQFIFQCSADGIDDELASWAYDEGMNVACLYDSSGGRGVTRMKWPGRMCDIYSGYAGGLSPETIAQQFPTIVEASKDQDFWIDMESGVRTDERFDVAKCEKVMEFLAPSLAQHS